MVSRRIFLGSAAWAAAAAVSFPSRGWAVGAPGESLDELRKEAARSKEAEVVVYSAYTALQPVLNEFSRKFPEIKVQFVSAFGSALLGRLSGESASGNHFGDIVLTISTDIEQLVKQDRIVAYRPQTSLALQARYCHPGDLFQMPFANLYNLGFNSVLTRGQKLPRSLPELLDDRWKGKFLYAEFTGGTWIDVCVATMLHDGRMTEDMLRTLIRNGRTAPNSTSVVRDLAQSRAPLALWASAYLIPSLKHDGAPVDMVSMPDYDFVLGAAASLLRSAPHPHAARLLLAWLYSPEGQKALAGSYLYGTMPGAPVPRGMPALPDYSLKDLPFGQLMPALAALKTRMSTLRGK